ncbi:unnamed protein product [Alternaria alternata]
MARDIDDDAYVAELLKQDAKKATKTYELVGIDAFNPRRCVTSFRTRDAVAYALKQATVTATTQRRADGETEVRIRAGIGESIETGNGMLRRVYHPVDIETEVEMSIDIRENMIVKRKTVPVGNGYDRGLPETNRAKTSTMKSKSVGDLEGETTPSANIQGTGRILEHLRHHGHGIPKDIGDVVGIETELVLEVQSRSTLPPIRMKTTDVPINDPHPQHPTLIPSKLS